MKEDDNTFFWYWFVNIPGIGNRLRGKLLERFGHPRVVYEAREEEYADILQERRRTYLKESCNTHKIHRSMRRLREAGVQFIHWESPEYPQQFRHLFDPPYGVYLKGRLPLAGRPVLAMVGSRMATPYGIQTAQWFAKELAYQGVQIVSGLAAGIDAASHKGAIKAGGYTLGILGGGIDTMYPRENYFLYQAMYEKGGVLSEYNLGVPNSPGLFPIRNRLISGIADGVFVLEAGEKSGTFITVDQALEQGKEVFALPGRISDALSVGCNRLIAQGALPVQKPEDITNLLFEKYDRTAWEKDGKQEEHTANDRNLRHKTIALSALTPEQRRIYSLADEKIPTSFNEFLEKSGCTFGQLQHVLLELEFSGLIYQSTQNMYLKKS